jgi:hypothetical protein
MARRETCLMVVDGSSVGWHLKHEEEKIIRLLIPRVVFVVSRKEARGARDDNQNDSCWIVKK